MKKILLYIPTFEGKISIEFYNWLSNIIIPEGYKLETSFTKRTLIDVARNMAVSKCIKNKYDYLFFVDDDTIPKTDVLVNLLGDCLQIVSGVYRARGGDKKLMLYNRKIINNKPYYYNMNKINLAIGGIQSVDAVGAGCLLIKRNVLEDMVKEYGDNIFQTGEMVFYDNKEYRFYREISDYENISRIYLSEDITFCERAKAMGYSIKFDTRCTCRHNTVDVDSSMLVDGSLPEVSILIKEDNFNNMNKQLLNKIKSNYEVIFIEDEINEDILSSINSKYVMCVDDIEIPYSIDTFMMESLQEVAITGPITVKNGQGTFRNDNIVTHCWMMKKKNLEKLIPVPTKLTDFTLYRKIKEQKWKCAILDATIKMNG